MTGYRDVGTAEFLLLVALATAAVDERHGHEVDAVPPEHRFVYHGLLNRGYIKVQSFRLPALELGLPDPGVPDLYVLTDPGAQLVLDYFAGR